MSVNDFKAFATEPGANVVDQATWAALTSLLADGFLAGIAESDQLNKAWRQASVIAYAIAQITSDTLGEDVLDDGDLPTLVAQITSMLGIVAGARAARVVTVSTALVISISDYAIGMNRTAGVAATAASLPNGAAIGQEFVIQDLVGNFNAAPVTVTPPSGTIAGGATYVMNVDGMSRSFRRYTADLWGVQ